MEKTKNEKEFPQSLQVDKVGLWSLASFRLRVALLVLLLIFFTGGVRFSISMAMVCMMNSTALALLSEDSKKFLPENGTNASHGACVMTQEILSEYEGPLVWSSDQQGLVFSAFGWGGFITAFPSGWLADRYGPKNLFFINALMNVVGVALTPIVALKSGYIGLFVVRFVIGAAQGCQIPCLSALMAKWFPALERSTMLGVISAGNQLSAVIWTPLGALLCQHKEFLGGWPAIFYLLGAFGVIVCIPWPFLITNSAERNKRISEKERNYIVFQLGGHNSEGRKAATKVIPWRAIFSSMPVLILMLCDFCMGLFTSLLVSYLPTYFKDVLLLDLNSNGLYNILPWLLMAAGKIIPSMIGDFIKRRTSWNHDYISKGFQFISSFGTASLLIGLSFVTCTQPLVALACLTLATFITPFLVPGYATSQLCIAPNYAGIIMSSGEVFFQIGMFISPYIIGAITYHGAQSEWQIVFWIMSATQVISGCAYGIFGTVAVQPWALSSKESQATLMYTRNSVVDFIDTADTVAERKSGPTVPKSEEDASIVQF